jgi:hypothetical protein
VSRAQIEALFRFELSRLLVRVNTLAGLLFFCAVTAFGHWEQWQGAVARGPSELYQFAYAAGLVALLSFGVAQDRVRHFDEYLIVNLVETPSYLIAKISAMVVLLTAFGAVCAAIEGVLAGSGVDAVFWHAAVLALSAIVLAPFALLVEALIDTSIPAAPVLLVYGVVTMVMFLSTGSKLLADLPGFTLLVQGDWVSVAALATRTALIASSGFLVAGAVAVFRLRRY